MATNITSFKKARTRLRALANKKKRAILQSFFKTAPGQYGAGDLFLGVTVPLTRSVAQHCLRLPWPAVLKLLRSKWHEERLLALLIMVTRYQKGSASARQKVLCSYLAHTKYINNWDLVDLSAHAIVGAALYDGSRELLGRLARSTLLWERRIAIVATCHFIKNHQFEDTLKIAELLLDDREDLIHKATGWMLREVGKRDKAVLVNFLEKHHQVMPRTMLRYAIERFAPPERERFMRRAPELRCKSSPLE